MEDVTVVIPSMEYLEATCDSRSIGRSQFQEDIDIKVLKAFCITECNEDFIKCTEECAKRKRFVEILND